MAFFDEDTIRQIHEQCDIVELVREYIPNMKQAGRRWKSLCPFHEDNDPSFYVNPERGTYKCFGCHESGDAISFVQNIERIDFPEAIKILANKLGITIKESHAGADNKKKELRDQILEANSLTLSFFEKMLADEKVGKIARDYIKSRNISEDMMKKFRLGYAPHSWDSLIKFAQQKKISMEIMAKAGLVNRKDRGGFYDFFRNRLIFPIFNTQDQIVGFGGRALGDDKAKYINSPDTPVFDKGRLLYGLNFAKARAREDRTLIVVEGYMDVLMMFQYGFENAVAPLGTAITDKHVRRMKTFADTVTVLFDGDSAGQKAAERMLDYLVEQDLPAKVVILPENKDPDQCLQEDGTEKFKTFLQSGLDVLDFNVNRVTSNLNPNNIHEKTKAVKKVAEVAAKVPDAVKRDAWIRKISDELSITHELIYNEIKKLRSNFKPRETKQVKKDVLPGVDATEILLTKILLHHPELITNAVEQINVDFFINETISKLFAEINKFAEEKKPFDFSVYLSYLDGDLKKIACDLYDEDPMWKDPKVVCEDCIALMHKKKEKEYKQLLLKKISIAQKKENKEEANRLLLEYTNLLTRK